MTIRKFDQNPHGESSVEFRVVTYNVHRCRGLDRRVLPRRIAEVLRPLQADVIALQEVLGAGPKGYGHDQELGAALGMGWAMGVTRLVRSRLYGNVIMSRFPIDNHTQYDLTWKRRKARGCQRVDILIGGHAFHIYNVHLGVGLRERHYQAKQLGTFIGQDNIRGPKVVLGDFNEWGRGFATIELTRVLKSLDLRAFAKRRRTYPGVFPVLHLDHLFYDGRVEILHVEIPRTRKSLIASDHLPLVADLRIQFPVG
ncbi:endonuclease/exonuclease/phosphatase family protein [Nitrospira sp. M1]